MPIRIRWNSKEHVGIALMIFGACGLIQVLFVFFSQFMFNVGNYLVIVAISSVATLCLFFSSIMIYESYAQVERREKLKSQFSKLRKEHPKLDQLLRFPISKPVLINFGVFSLAFFIAYLIANLYVDNILSYVIAENVGVIACFFVANFLETNYAKVNRI